MIFAVCLFHVFLGLNLRIDFFPFLNCATMLVFVPGSVWERLGVRERAS